MTWHDYEERYGESREDHYVEDEEDDDRQECTMCGDLYQPEELETIRGSIHNEKVCKSCLSEIEQTITEAIS